VGGETFLLEIQKLINLIWNKEELPHQWRESVVVPVHKKGDKTDCSNYQGISLLLLHTEFYLTFFSVGQPHFQIKLLEITNVDFDVIVQ
jgi:hypothetical protein